MRAPQGDRERHASRVDPLAHVDAEIIALDAVAHAIEEPSESTGAAEGRRATLNLSSNDYLGLRDHPLVRQAAIAAIERYGVGAAAGRNAAERTDLHEELEARLAAFKRAEAALTFQSGFVTNLGTFSALVGGSDLVLYDELSHASTIDGARLSGATARAFAHRDLAQLEQRLREARVRGSTDGGYRSILVATDGVFGMDGEIAPLPEICALAERYEAAVVVDDAHATGVLGTNGRGSVDHFGLYGRVQLQIGTLSKAIGVFGGFVASEQRIRDYIARRARPVLYSTLLPPALVAASLAAIELIEREPARLQRLWSNARRFRDGLKRLGFDTGSSETPIVPILLSSADAARRFSRRLRREAIRAQPVASAPARRARLRTIVTASHSPADLDRALQVIERIGRELGEVG